MEQMVAVFVFTLAFFYVECTFAQQPEKPAPGIVRLDPRFDKLVPKEAKLEKIADGYTWVEGPVWDRKGGYLLFSDIPANSILKWKEGEGASVFMKPSGYSGAKPFKGREPGSNGLIFDLNGKLVVCEHGDRRLTRVEDDGKKSVLADRYEGKRLNSPNDVIVKSNGDFYFTDPAYGLPKSFNDSTRELDFCGLFRVSTDGKVTLLTKEINAPNGIAFSPDEKKLYVTDSHDKRPAWLVYDLKEDGMIENGRLFHDAKEFKKKFPGSPDGMKVDKDGNVYGSGPGGIFVFAPDGTHLGTIETGVATSNCNWGDDGSTLYITASSTVYRIKLDTKGAGYK
jgi:gluconolactonase